MGPQSLESPRAMRACLACRTLKRKCTRELPACALCVRLHKICDYVSTNSNGIQQASQYNELSDRKPLDLSGSFPGGAHGNFPARYFLDSDSHQQLSMNVIPATSIPPGTLELLGCAEDVQAVCDRYFTETQTWLPFLSAKRIAERIRDFGEGSDIRLELLLLCMKLVTISPSDEQNAATSLLYQTTRDLLGRAENSCLISLELLQSTILMSVYEMGHGIYPAGFLTVARAARLGVIMGFHDRKHAPQLFKEPDTWTLCEEERRTWWAVIILDRFVQLGIPGLPLATPEPVRGDLLPCTEFRWDNRQVGVNEPLFVQPLSVDSEIGFFSNACQSAHVLGRVLEHRNHVESCIDYQIRLSEAHHQHQVLTALTTYLAHKYSEDEHGVTGSCLVAMALCYSSRLILYNMYACNELYVAKGRPRLPEERMMQQVSLEGIEDMTKSISEPAQHVLTFGEGDLFSFSPLICHSLYQGASECAWLVREHGDQEQVMRLKTIIESLVMLGRRWKVVDEYLKLLEDEGSLSGMNL